MWVEALATISANEEATVGVSVSLVLIAAGAILTWAVDATVSGLDITAVGVILMIVGLVGLILSLVFWSTWGGFTRPADGGTTTVVDRERVVR
jgi:hypothetical protein